MAKSTRVAMGGALLLYPAVEYAPSLDDDGIAQAARQHHALWGGARNEVDHVAHVREQLARSGGRLRYCALRSGGSLVCSLKRYALALEGPFGTLAGIGLGAVYTPEGERRRGRATQLVTQVLAHARSEGARAALLFSDIGPAYYERLGFRPLRAESEWTPRVELPSARAYELERCDDVASLARLRVLLAGEARIARDAAGWRYFSWRNGPHAHTVLRDGERACGYLSVSREGSELWLDDAALFDAERPRALASLRALAESCGADTVVGWLPNRLGGAPFRRVPRTRCVPMIAPLDSECARAIGPSDWHFWSLDRF